MKSPLHQIVLVFLVLLFSSCYEEDIDSGEDKLGAKLDNPYSVDNMTEAWENIKNEVAESGRFDVSTVLIQTSHLYVKFMPSDSAEYEQLDNLGLELYDYPLDYEVDFPVGEFAYTQPNLPIGKPNVQYTVVYANFQFPENISYQVLESLYLPDDIGYSAAGRVLTELPNCLQTMLVNEAMSLTGNSDDISIIDCEGGGTGGGGTGGGDTGGTGGAGSSGGCSKCPKGRILVENPVSGTITIEGKNYDGVPMVKARVRKWFKIKTAYTNENGEFVINHVFGGNRKVNYGVKYKNKHASIKPAAIAFGPAFLNGPKQTGYWEYKSKRNSGSYLWGAIMKALYDYNYVYAPMFDIGKPPNGMRIRACANNDCGVTTMLHASTNLLNLNIGGTIFSDIKIGSKSEPFQGIYATTIHELGHAAHWNLVGDWAIGSDVKMALASKLVREGWASGITDTTYHIKFPSRGRQYWGTCVNNSDLRLNTMLSDGYPRVLVRDLMDDVNEFNTSNECDDLDDEVEGFSIRQIFRSLEYAHGSFGKTSMEKWRDKLIEKKPDQAEEIRTYFAPWIN